MEDSEQIRKLFLGGLNYNTTEDTLKSSFGQYGTLSS
jgi:RNA recognition motif-containing protein